MTFSVKDSRKPALLTSLYIRTNIIKYLYPRPNHYVRKKRENFSFLRNTLTNTRVIMLFEPILAKLRQTINSFLLKIIRRNNVVFTLIHYLFYM